LIRNIGNDGTLISKDSTSLVLSRLRHSEITEPSRDQRFSLEAHHNGPHVWVDGQLSAPITAAQDPIFFLHHAFIDYIWELFRTKQRLMGIVSDYDYPVVQNPLHRPYRWLAGWPYIPRLLNIDGFGQQFAQQASYQISPSCGNCRNPRWPFPVLMCDRRIRQCVSAEGLIQTSRGTLAFSGGSAENIARSRSITTAFGSLPIGPTFSSPFRDPRTRNDALPNSAFTSVN